MKNIVIIEDHPIVLSNMSLLLNSQDDLQVVDTFMRGGDVRESSVFEIIDIVFLDINLPDASGVDLCRFLTRRFPNLKIIGISAYDEWDVVQEFLEAGAYGYVVKGSDNSHLFRAVEAVLNGEIYLCTISQESRREHLTRSEETKLILTKREKSILQGWNSACSSFENAERLNMDELQLTNYIKSLEQKYHVKGIQSLKSLLTIKTEA